MSGGIQRILDDAAPGRFLKPRLLGKGAMGLVFRVQDQTLGKTVALKVLAPAQANNPHFRTRFLQEAEVLGRLDHPAIPSLLEVREEPVPWICMDFVDGPSLKQHLRDQGPRPPAEVAGWIRQLASALSSAHAIGVIHRDLKPSNLLLDPQGLVHLLDWGIAADTHSTRLTRSGVGVGTPAYTPPEQLRGADPVPANDVFGLAATACFLVTGRPPLRGGEDEQEATLPSLDSETEALLGPMLRTGMMPLDRGRPETIEALVAILG